MDIPYYPIQEYGPVMKGLVIGGLGIFHVFLAQGAIGGGMLMCYFEYLGQTGRSPHARQMVDGLFRLLVLVSFVIGALTGVAMWFTSIQISPRTIGMMVDEFHWIWATEWTFFCLEVVAGYAFYRYGKRLDDRGRLALLTMYTLAAWFSLFWINGILSWQLTPGDWVNTRSVWSGFFNPSFWPSLIFRTIASMSIAALVACVVINVSGPGDREDRRRLIHQAAHFLAPMIIMPAVGIWFLASMPADSRSWAMGGSIVISMCLMVGVMASLLIGIYAIGGLLSDRLYVNAWTASLLVFLAFAATAGGEFVREGVRKPYTIRETLYSYSLTQPEIQHLRKVGCVTDDPYPLRNADSYPNEQLRTGAKVFRIQCSICHTLGGANNAVELTATWTNRQKRLNIAQLQRTKPFMPPFAGTAEEVEALVQLLNWHHEGQPKSWKTTFNPEHLREIQQWLDEAGTEPGIRLMAAH